jgi:spermidine synthase
VVVIDVMEAVIDWHRRGLVPIGNRLSSDPRVTLHHGDFFEMALRENAGFGGIQRGKQVHAVLLDIDHSPTHWLNPGNGAFYSDAGLRGIEEKLHPGGVFGLWSNDPPESSFARLMESVFDSVSSRVVEFANPYTGDSSSNTVYLGLKARST